MDFVIKGFHPNNAHKEYVQYTETVSALDVSRL